MHASTETAAELLGRLLEALEPEIEAAEALRERLHARAELAHAEHETAATVLAALEADDAERVVGTGIVARLGPPDGGAVALRAELDALALTERTGAPFASTGGAM